MEIKFYARYGSQIVAHKCSDIIFEITALNHGKMTLVPHFCDLVKAAETCSPLDDYYIDKETAQHLAPVSLDSWLQWLTKKPLATINEDFANAHHHLPTKKSDTLGCFVALFEWRDHQASRLIFSPAIRVSDYSFGAYFNGEYIPAVDLATNNLIPLPNNRYLSKEECELDAHIPIIDFDD